MEIIIGELSGFCNGVKNCVSKTIDELNHHEIIYALGDVVHNEVVINDLKNKGLIVVNNIEDIPNNSKVIIRAHGENINTYQQAKEKNIELIDLTCGKVKLIHHKILSHKDNSFIIIIGKKIHPESIAHKSYSKNSYIVENKNDLRLVYKEYLHSKPKLLYVVAQTTMNSEIFNELVNEIKNLFKNIDILVDNTICNTTKQRQIEVVKLSQKVDKMIIVGGKNSSNTKELAVIAQKYCPKVYLIQTYQDLEENMFSIDDVVGIEAGASTPSEVVDEIIEYLENIYKKVK